MFILRLTFLLLVSLFRNDGVEANPDAKRLYDDLLSHYNRLIRPVSNNSQAVTVGLGRHLTQLIDLVTGSNHRVRSKYNLIGGSDLLAHFLFHFQAGEGISSNLVVRLEPSVLWVNETCRIHLPFAW